MFICTFPISKSSKRKTHGGWNITRTAAKTRGHRYSSESIATSFSLVLIWPHKWKSRGFKSGDPVGQIRGPFLSIQSIGNLPLRYLTTIRDKCAGVPSSKSLIFLLSCIWINYISWGKVLVENSKYIYCIRKEKGDDQSVWGNNS